MYIRDTYIVYQSYPKRRHVHGETKQTSNKRLEPNHPYGFNDLRIALRHEFISKYHEFLN